MLKSTSLLPLCKSLLLRLIRWKPPEIKNRKWTTFHRGQCVNLLLLLPPTATLPHVLTAEMQSPKLAAPATAKSPRNLSRLKAAGRGPQSTEGSPGTGGPGDTRLICGTRITGTKPRTRKENRSFCCFVYFLPLLLSRSALPVYLGAYENEEAAARTYDLAALKYWGLDGILNFPASMYAEEYREMQGMTKEDYLASLRRRSSGFSRGASKYRGVARHHHNGRWEARIGRVYGNKYLYLGTFSTQEEAAQAYDRAALIYRGQRAVTNFDISHYTESKPSLRPPAVSAPPMPPHLMPSFETPTTFRSLEKLSSPMEPPVLPSSYGLGDLTWTTCIDSSYDSFPMSDLLTDGFVDDIEQLFDGSEMGDGDVSGGGRVAAESPAGTSGVVAPSPVAPFAASEMRSAKSFAFPISICT